MPDSKITALTSIGTSTDPVLDQMVIVDVSDGSMAATGTTKKVSLNQLLSSNPSATGGLTLSGALTAGSATISGDLTVRTNKLTVASTGVGINGTSAAYPLEINGGASASTSQFKSTSASVIARFTDGTAETGYIGSGAALIAGIGRTDFGIASNGALVFGVSTGLAMTLNSTGLGVGEAATVSRLQARGSTSDSSAYILYGKAATGNVICFMRNDGRFLVGNGTSDNLIVTETGNVTIGTNSAQGKITSVDSANQNGFYIANTNALFTGEGFTFRPSRNTTNGSFYAFSYYNVGAAAYKFYVVDSGAIYSTSTSITAISDASLKENVKDLETGLSQILALKPRRFDWKDGSASNVSGFIAQEVENVLPDLVTSYRYNETESKKALRLGDMIPTLVKAIQELTARVEALEA